MMYKVKVWNKYEVIALLTSNNTINFENFYKDELVQFLNMVRDYIKEVNKKIS